MSELQENLNIDDNAKKFKNKFVFICSLIGPGFLAAIGDNDAGGIISYCITGIKFGISFFIPLSVCLIIITYTIQELSMRLSVVTQKGFISLIKEHYGKFWTAYNITAIFAENILMLSTEFIGMSAGLIMLGIPMWIGVMISLILVIFVITFAGYVTKERVSLFIGSFNVLFIILAIMIHPNVEKMPGTFLNIDYCRQSKNIFLYIAAIVGNSVAPWMIFFQGSACLDKGIIKKNIKLGRMDTMIGCIVQVSIAVCVIVSGSSLFGKIINLDSLGPSSVIAAFVKNTGNISGILFGIGLFNAGFLASITISLSTSWCVSETFNWNRSLNSKISESPKFYGIYIGSVVLASVIALFPKLPLNYITVLIQVMGGFIMVPIFIFLILLTNKKEVMGKYINRLSTNIRSFIIIDVLISAIILLLVNLFVL